VTHFLIALFTIVLAWSNVATGQACRGDCNQDCAVAVDDLVKLVVIALGNDVIDSCTAGDANGDGQIAIDDIVAAVTDALSGCSCLPETLCGNGRSDAGEECDDGGLCVGGPTAGTPCTQEDDCDGNGVCDGGSHPGTLCQSNTDCASGRCVHCKPSGGDGCASNCTFEHDVPFTLEPGVPRPQLKPGTSGLMFSGAMPAPFPVPLAGTFMLTIGNERDGRLPFVVKASSVQFPPVPVSNVACACVRGVPLETCGGSVFEPDGRPSPSCTKDFAGGISCPADRACAFVHGPGNSASGFIACEGTVPVNISVTQNAGGTSGSPHAPVLVFEGASPPGSVLAFNSLAVGTTVGSCSATFCSDTAPTGQRGAPFTQLLTTGQACCEISNANDTDGLTIGPECAQGAPVSCTDVLSAPASVSGLGLVGAAPVLNQPTLGDVCVTTQLFAQ
jgi:hypothetical protein